MMTITLGTEGDQPFKIKNKGVSHRHATITIDDDGRWILEDQGSTNGTFIRNEENGQMQPVGVVEITPMTLVCLGPDNAQGCQFYARQVLAENHDDYKKEYEYLTEMNARYEQRLEKVEKRMKLFKWVSPCATLMVVGISCLPPVSDDIALRLLRIGAPISSALSLLYDGNAVKKRIEKERKRFSHCPNPNCSYRLRPADILNYQCPKCKKPK